MQSGKRFWADEIVRLYFQGLNFNEALEATKEMMMNYELFKISKRGV